MSFDATAPELAYWASLGIRPYDFWIKPLGLNNVYGIARGGGRYVTTEGKVYKEFVAEQIAVTDAYYGWPLPETEFLEFTYIFFYPESPVPFPKGVKQLPKHQQTMLRTRQHQCFYFGNNTLQPHDITNFFKLIEDEFVNHFQIDDRHNITVHGYKRVHGFTKPRVIVLVSEASLDERIIHGGQTVDWEQLCELRSLIEE